jgi:hypothetical protein
VISRVSPMAPSDTGHLGQVTGNCEEGLSQSGNRKFIATALRTE